MTRIVEKVTVFITDDLPRPISPQDGWLAFLHRAYTARQPSSMSAEGE